MQSQLAYPDWALTLRGVDPMNAARMQKMAAIMRMQKSCKLVILLSSSFLALIGMQDDSTAAPWPPADPPDDHPEPDAEGLLGH